MKSLADLVARWREQAEAYEVDTQPGAGLLRRVADELEEALLQHELEELTPTQAAVEEGCHSSTIRRKFPGRKTVTRAELAGKRRGNVDGPDLAEEVLRGSHQSGRMGKR